MFLGSPQVSVVLPTYNRRHSLPNAIESVLRQTFTDFELIIVDDCSTDDTLEYLESITDDRVRVIRHARNGGAAAARNSGIAAARAPVIAFQDSDDEWLISMLERQYASLMRAEKDVGAAYCGKIVYGRDEQGNLGPRLAAYMPDRRRQNVQGDIYAEILKHGIVGTPTLMVRKEVIDAVGPFDETLRIGEDWEFVARIAKHTSFAFIDDPLHMSYINGDSISHRRLDGAFTLMRLLERHSEAYAVRPALHAEKLFEVARIFQRAGHWRKSIPYLLQSLRLNPARPKTWAAFTIGVLRGLQERPS